jgi:hypothetical protein
MRLPSCWANKAVRAGKAAPAESPGQRRRLLAMRGEQSGWTSLEKRPKQADLAAANRESGVLVAV